jgi:HSP20 family protein
MTLTRWDPFKDLIHIQERMNRMFEDSLVRSRGDDDPSAAAPAWTPAVDIYETPDEVVLLADLPGVQRDGLDVRVEGNTLIMSGRRGLAAEVAEENFHRMERGYGAFQRTFTLPATIRQEGIRAAHHDGVLKVTLPKSEATRPLRIKVEPGPQA